MPTNTYYMKRALHLALRAEGETSPNPLVGAVVVKNGQIVSEGWHAYCGGDHAEVIALNKAGLRARGATLYVTLEPCSHFGRTPPCVNKILESGIKEVVVGTKDPNPVNNGKSLLKLKKAGIQVSCGLLEQEIAKINEPFLKYITEKMPFVVAKIAQSLDGKVATKFGESKWITSKVSRDFAHRLRYNFDAILIGINTAFKDDPFLNPVPLKKSFNKIILDSRLQLSLKANLFKKTDPGTVFIAVNAGTNPKKIKQFQSAGINILISPRRAERIPLKWLFREMAIREVSSILIEGGSKTIGSAVRENLVDKFLIFQAPMLIGDQHALSSVSGLEMNKLSQSVKLKDLTVRRISEDLMIEAYVHRNR